MLVSVSVEASADEKNYIVELKQDISLFSSDADRYGFCVVSESELFELLDLGLVESYEEDAVVELFDTDYSYDYTYKKWNYERVNASKAKELGCYGQTVKIALIDSGVHPHPDIKDRILQGYNYVDENNDVTDNIGHGTFVSGIIAANATDGGISGVTNCVSIVPLKCFENGFTTTLSVISRAIRDAVDLYDCDIINMSLGTTSKSSTLKAAIDHAYSKGAIVVAAVGNKNATYYHYPAAYDNVIGVGSVDFDNVRSWFSQYNDSVFITAPGEDVWSTSIEDTYWLNEGTSFSTPLVTSAVAIMMNIDEDITYQEICSYLKDSAKDLGASGYDVYYGHGLLDIEACIELMLKDTDYFISPIYTTDTVSEVVVYNNTASYFEGIITWGNYTGGYMLDFDANAIRVEAGKTAKPYTFFTDNLIKCFIWKDISTLTVLTGARDNK